jgi:hypothetical protein
VALGADGPLHEQGPGDLTRWMGLPWQADTAYCRSGYDRAYDPFAPSFWPARVPNQVLLARNYDIVMDGAQPRAHRLAAFAQRWEWVEPLRGSIPGQMEEMVRLFGSMGVLEARPGIAGDPDFPPVMLVASFGKGIPEPAGVPLEAPAEQAGLVAADRQRWREASEAGWGPEEERRRAPLPVRYPGR